MAMALTKPAVGDFIDTGRGLIRMTVKPDHAGGPHPVMGWEVDDIAAAATVLRDRGAPLIVYDGMGQDELGVWSSPDGAVKVGWFPDPDGNLLSLSQG